MVRAGAWAPEGRIEMTLEQRPVDEHGSGREVRARVEPGVGDVGEQPPATFLIDPSAPVDIHLDSCEPPQGLRLRGEGFRSLVARAQVEIAGLPATRGPLSDAFRSDDDRS